MRWNQIPAVRESWQQQRTNTSFSTSRQHIINYLWASPVPFLAIISIWVLFICFFVGFSPLPFAHPTQSTKCGVTFRLGRSGHGAFKFVSSDSRRKLQTSNVRLAVSRHLIYLVHNLKALIRHGVACSCTASVNGLISSIFLTLPSSCLLFSPIASGQANSFVL
jgi:hypothetical protein